MPKVVINIPSSFESSHKSARENRGRQFIEAASRSRVALLVLLTLLVAGIAAHANTVTLGVFSFNTLIPGAPASPGVNVFAIDNFTGSFSLPPDFPAMGPLTLLNSAVVLTLQGGSQQTINLGNLGSGSYTPIALQFSAAVNFTSAAFTATLSPTTFPLSDGSTFHAANAQLSVNLTPSSGTFLSPDVDFSSITVSNVAAPVPEPGTGAVALACLGAAVWLRKRYRPPN